MQDDVTLTMVERSRQGRARAEGFLPILAKVGPRTIDRKLLTLFYFEDRLRLVELQKQNGYWRDVWDDSSGAPKVLGRDFKLLTHMAGWTFLAYRPDGVARFLECRDDNLASLEDLTLRAKYDPPALERDITEIVACQTHGPAPQTFLIGHGAGTGNLDTYQYDSDSGWHHHRNDAALPAGAHSLVWFPHSDRSDWGYLLFLLPTTSGIDLHIAQVGVDGGAFGPPAPVQITDWRTMQSWVPSGEPSQLASMKTDFGDFLITYDPATGDVRVNAFDGTYLHPAWQGTWPGASVIRTVGTSIFRYGVTDGAVDHWVMSLR